MVEYKLLNEQNYEQIKDNLLITRKLFEDDFFPANDLSIYRVKKFLAQKIKWKRPHDFVKNPQFITNKVEPDDLHQGQIGNCWFIAALASVLTVPEYSKRIIPECQTFDNGNYAGIFHFRFWKDGQWIDVVIDDRIPVDSNNNPVFCKNLVEKNEMFGPLIEKAYAKLNICYEFLTGGNAKDALLDLTGGINETYNLTLLSSSVKGNLTDPDILWELMFKAFGLKSLFSCAAEGKYYKNREMSYGLKILHAYSILNLYQVIKTNEGFDSLRAVDQLIEPSTESIKLLL